MIFRDTVIDYGSWDGVSTRLRWKVEGGFVEFPQGSQQNTPQMQRFSFGFVENRTFFRLLVRDQLQSCHHSLWANITNDGTSLEGDRGRLKNQRTKKPSRVRGFFERTNRLIGIELLLASPLGDRTADSQKPKNCK
jgi:hypothetical protein